MTTGESRNVTTYGNWDNTNGYIDQAAISRDGAQLAFWHYKYGPTEKNLRVIGTDGKGERVLYRAKKEWGMPTDWSPDGKYIVMQLERGQSLMEGVADFVLVSIADGSTRVLKTYEYIRRYRPKILFSPDGRYLAYDYPMNKGQVQGDLHVVAIDGSSDVVVAADPAQDTLAAWTPDGSILFASTRSGKEALWRVPVNNGRQTGEPELVRPDFVESSVLGTTKAGAVYYLSRTITTNAYLTTFDPPSGRLSTAITRLTPRFTDITSTPAWSPDGREVAYCIHRTSDGTITIGIRSLDTGKERELLPAVKLLRVGNNLKWSSDGRSLLALASSETQTGLYRIEVASGEAKFVTKGSPASFIAAEWTANGKWFFTTDDSRHSIVRRNTESGEEKTLYTAPNSLRSFSLSSDGKFLAFIVSKNRPEDRLHVRLIPADGGAPTDLFTASYDAILSWSGREMAWTPDSKTLLFAHRKENAPEVEIWRVSAQGGDAQPTGFKFQRTAGPLQFHPDGRRLAFSRSEAKTEYCVMENFLPVQKASK